MAGNQKNSGLEALSGRWLSTHQGTRRTFRSCSDPKYSAGHNPCQGWVGLKRRVDRTPPEELLLRSRPRLRRRVSLRLSTRCAGPPLALRPSVTAAAARAGRLFAGQPEGWPTFNTKKFSACVASLSRRTRPATASDHTTRHAPRKSPPRSAQQACPPPPWPTATPPYPTCAANSASRP